MDPIVTGLGMLLLFIIVVVTFATFEIASSNVSI
jgi:hypothetical protein